MSLGSFLERTVGAKKNQLRPGQQRCRDAAQRYQLETLNRKLSLGENITTVLRERHGDACLQACIASVLGGDSDERAARFPYGFWRYFVEEEMHLHFTTRQRIHCYRCFELFTERAQLGDTRAAQRDGQAPKAKRRKGGEYNASKARGLMWMLLQYFVDEVQVLRSRADSSLLLDKAKAFREELLLNGWSEAEVPKLTGSAGWKWLARWRREYNLSMKATGLQLKVLWSKVKSRCRTLLTNIFRLRHFWSLVHPGAPLRFISADQKPSWFNNTGHTGAYGVRGEKAPSIRENFAKSRERYTILTIVASECEYSPETGGTPPHVFVLFKGKTNGRIVADIRARLNLPDWVHVQVQECGSYREEDVVEALRILLPVAQTTQESMILLLDWFSAHRCESVIDFVERRGHVVLFHGGGCTPFTQINDTHLHGVLQRFLIRIENRLTHAMRTDMHLNGERGIPTLSRDDVMEVVQAAWLSMDHKHVARVGYVQTGPMMPMEGPISREDVARDLRTVCDEIDPPVGRQEMGTSVRDEAIAFVNAGYPGRWSSWTHVKRLILEHDLEDDPIPEGLDAAGWAVEEDDDDDTEDYREFDSEDEGDDSLGGGGGGGEALVRADDGDADDGDSVVDLFFRSDEEDGVGGAVAAHSSAASIGGMSVEAEPDEATSVATVSVETARDVLIEEARKNRDDVSLRRLLNQRDKRKKHVHDAATPAALVLQKSAEARQNEWVQQRREAKDKARQARLDSEVSTSCHSTCFILFIVSLCIVLGSMTLNGLRVRQQSQYVG